MERAPSYGGAGYGRRADLGNTDPERRGHGGPAFGNAVNGGNEAAAEYRYQLRFSLPLAARPVRTGASSSEQPAPDLPAREGVAAALSSLPAASAPPVGRGAFGVQLGAYRSDAGAVAAKAALDASLADVLRRGGHALEIDASRGDGFSRVVFARTFATRNAAAAACAQIKERVQDCYLVPLRLHRQPGATTPPVAWAQGRRDWAGGEPRRELASESYVVQLGAFFGRAGANEAKTDLDADFSDILRRGGYTLEIDAATGDGLSHVIVGRAFAARARAADLCAEITTHGSDCYVARSR